MITGLGRFCLGCKSRASSREYISTSSGRRPKLDNELSRSDTNKLLSFSENPSKYATGTLKTKEKVAYLNSIKNKFSEGQLSTYMKAYKIYEATLVDRRAFNSQKTNFSSILSDAFNNHRSVKIRYKGSWRTIDPYSLNSTYVVAYCHFAQDIRTFRIDRIQGMELLDSFQVDNTLGAAAKNKIIDAPHYKGYFNKRY